MVVPNNFELHRTKFDLSKLIRWLIGIGFSGKARHFPVSRE
jgi:hypothetical protein